MHNDIFSQKRAGHPSVNQETQRTTEENPSFLILKDMIKPYVQWLDISKCFLYFFFFFKLPVPTSKVQFAVILGDTKPWQIRPLKYAV